MNVNEQPTRAHFNTPKYVSAENDSNQASKVGRFLTIEKPFFISSSPKKTMPTAREAALKALQLDDKLDEAHRSMAQVKSYYDWDWKSGEREFKQAIELNPGDLIHVPETYL